MNYLQYIQKENSDIYEIYVPKIHCSYCDNNIDGDSPTIFIKECNECEERDWQSDCCTAKPFGNQFIEEEKTGICSECYKGANFTDLNMEE
tara:strand:- start:2687 stop:2959 length:273 start_codon:yes stop_codon:yes gene_type:complete